MRTSKVLLVDFEDSFTFNIASELLSQGFKVEVIHYLELESKLQVGNIDFITVFGPGPGHPDDYQQFYSLVRTYFINKKNLFVGICLGHQIFWRSRGLSVKKSLNQKHGETEKVTVPKWAVFNNKDWGLAVDVQRYNSLVVDHTELLNSRFVGLSENNEFMMSCSDTFITYQFHPESVGTSFPELFFGALLKLGYTNKDERTY